MNIMLEVGSLSESVVVEAEKDGRANQSQAAERNARQSAASADLSASANVTDLQRRVVGVLPIAINVPRTGNSWRFARPLLLDEETKLTFRYNTK
jgi:hypothetical protein